MFYCGMAQGLALSMNSQNSTIEVLRDNLNQIDEIMEDTIINEEKKKAKLFQEVFSQVVRAVPEAQAAALTTTWGPVKPVQATNVAASVV